MNNIIKKYELNLMQLFHPLEHNLVVLPVMLDGIEIDLNDNSVQ